MGWVPEGEEQTDRNRLRIKLRQRSEVERFHEARGFDEWQADRAWLHAPAFAQVGKLVESLNEGFTNATGGKSKS